MQLTLKNPQFLLITIACPPQVPPVNISIQALKYGYRTALFGRILD
jgi:hypothetical protein